MLSLLFGLEVIESAPEADEVVKDVPVNDAKMAASTILFVRCFCLLPFRVLASSL